MIGNGGVCPNVFPSNDGRASPSVKSVDVLRSCTAQLGPGLSAGGNSSFHSTIFGQILQRLAWLNGGYWGFSVRLKLIVIGGGLLWKFTVGGRVVEGVVRVADLGRFSSVSRHRPGGLVGGYPGSFIARLSTRFGVPWANMFSKSPVGSVFSLPAAGCMHTQPIVEWMSNQPTVEWMSKQPTVGWVSKQLIVGWVSD